MKKKNIITYVALAIIATLLYFAAPALLLNIIGLIVFGAIIVVIVVLFSELKKSIKK